jgi:hypothetical protein
VPQVVNWSAISSHRGDFDAGAVEKIEEGVGPQLVERPGIAGALAPTGEGIDAFERSHCSRGRKPYAHKARAALAVRRAGHVSILDGPSDAARGIRIRLEQGTPQAVAKLGGGEVRSLGQHPRRDGGGDLVVGHREHVADNPGAAHVDVAGGQCGEHSWQRLGEVAAKLDLLRA